MPVDWHGEKALVYTFDQSNLWVCCGDISLMEPTAALTAENLLKGEKRTGAKQRLELLNAPPQQFQDAFLQFFCKKHRASEIQ